MDRYRTISLIDPDLRRRAAYTTALKGSRFHIEPFDSISEFSLHANRDTLVLIHDDDLAVQELLDDMRERNYWSPVLGYGKNLDELRCSQVIMLGLIGYLPTPFALCDVEALLDFRKEHLTRLVDARYQAAEVRQKLSKLTKRESQVLGELHLGLTNREIGDKLVISARTVEIHRANMMRKLDAQSAAEAVGLSMQATTVF